MPFPGLTQKSLPCNPELFLLSFLPNGQEMSTPKMTLKALRLRWQRMELPTTTHHHLGTLYVRIILTVLNHWDLGVSLTKARVIVIKTQIFFFLYLCHSNRWLPHSCTLFLSLSLAKILVNITFEKKHCLVCTATSLILHKVQYLAVISAFVTVMWESLSGLLRKPLSIFHRFVLLQCVVYIILWNRSDDEIPLLKII